MHISRIDLNLFVVFEAIYSEGSITRAAKTMNLSQPALSHALNRLRELFNDPLFQRLGSKMAPTPLAHSLIGQIRTALQTLDISVNSSGLFDPQISTRQFTLGFRDVLESTALPTLMDILHTTAPQVKLASVQVERRELETELMAGSLDLAVDVSLPFPASIRRRLISRDSMVVVARQNHPGINKRLTLANYLRQSHVLVSSRRSGPGLEDLELSRQGHQRHIGLRCQHYFAASLVVSASDLLLTMPGQYAQLANRNTGNQIWPLPLAMPPFDVYLYWHENAENDPSNSWLRELVMRCFGEINSG